MKLTDFIDFEIIVKANYDNILEEITSFDSQNIFCDEKVKNKHKSKADLFIEKSKSLEYTKIKDKYFKPAFCNIDNLPTIKKESIEVQQLCELLSDSESDTSADSSTDASDSSFSEEARTPKRKILTMNLFYKSTDNSTILFYIDFDIDYVDIQMFGLVNLVDGQFIFCGNHQEHPFIATNNFGYDNSDGSGPTITDKLSKKLAKKDSEEPDSMLNVMTKIFNGFCLDVWH